MRRLSFLEQLSWFFPKGGWGRGFAMPRRSDMDRWLCKARRGFPERQPQPHKQIAWRKNLQSALGPRRGFSLIESAIAVALVGGLYLVALNTVGASRVTQNAFADRERGTRLAEALLVEALALPFDDPDGTAGGLGIDGGESAADRSTFDDLDDFHGYNEAAPVDRWGTLIPGAGRYRRTAEVRYVTPAAPDVPTANKADLKRIAVTVTVDGRHVVTLVGLGSSAWPDAAAREDPAP